MHEGQKYRVVIDGLGEIICRERELFPAAASIAYGDDRGRAAPSSGATIEPAVVDHKKGGFKSDDQDKHLWQAKRST